MNDVSKQEAAGISASFRMVDDSPFAMAFLEGPTHIVRCANAAFCSLVRKDREILVGHPFAEVLPDEAEADLPGALFDCVYRTGDSMTLTEERASNEEGDSRFPAAYWSWSAWP